MINDNDKTQRQFIYLLLHDKSAIVDWLDSNLKIKHFDQEYRIILETITICYDKDVLLSRKYFNKLMSDTQNDLSKIQQEQLYINCMMHKVDRNDFPLLISKIIESYVLEKSTDSISNFKGDMENKGSIFALKSLAESLQDIIQDSADESSEIVYDDIRTFSSERIGYVRGIRDGSILEPPMLTCGIPEIDDTMMTGYKSGTLTLFCADVGGFKSTMMLNIGLNIWEQGQNVLFVPIEMDKSQMYNKAWARQSRVPSDRIDNPILLTEEEVGRLEKAQTEWDEHQSKFFILQIPGETKVSSIKRQIEKYSSIFNPRLVVIDYIDNMSVDIDRHGRHDLEISDMLQTLRIHGRDKNYAIVSGAQLGRDALKRIRKAAASKDEMSINSEDIRGAHTFSSDADNIYAQIMNISQPGSLLDLYVVKARNGRRVFSNGTMRATLEVMPEISLIQSQEIVNIEGEDVLTEMFDDKENKISIEYNDDDFLEDNDDDDNNSGDDFDF
jgi:replicative DNA helicase